MSTNRKRKVLLSLNVALLLIFIFTLAGNLVDLATGGNGTNSWYGQRGVFNRLFLSSETASDRNKNGISDIEEETESNKNQSKNKQKKQNTQHSVGSLHYVSEQRYAPKGKIASIPAIPAGSYVTGNFSILSGKIYCVISSEVECIVTNFGNTNSESADTNNPSSTKNNAVKFVLTSDGTLAPQNVGNLPRNSSYPVLAPGASATSGDFACTASANSLDCWNLSTGKGMTVSSTKATKYSPK